MSRWCSNCTQRVNELSATHAGRTVVYTRPELTEADLCGERRRSKPTLELG